MPSVAENSIDIIGEFMESTLHYICILSGPVTVASARNVYFITNLPRHFVQFLGADSAIFTQIALCRDTGSLSLTYGP